MTKTQKIKTTTGTIQTVSLTFSLKPPFARCESDCTGNSPESVVPQNAVGKAIAQKWFIRPSGALGKNKVTITNPTLPGDAPTHPELWGSGRVDIPTRPVEAA